MSLTLQSNFIHKVNSVLPLAQNATGLSVRVASQGSDVLGTLTAVGAVSTVAWTLKNAPAWVTLAVDQTGTVASLNFSSATFQPDPYEFFVSCTDGVTSATFAVFLEIRQPFFIAANTSNPVVINSSTLSIPSYDNTIADIVVQGFGLFSSVQSGCNFILPSTLPLGLNLVTSDETKLVFRVDDSTLTDLPGGLKLFTNSPVAVPLTIKAYQPNSFYDNPDRAYVLTLSVGSQSQKAGILNFGMGAFYDTVNNVLSIDAEIDTLLGSLQANGISVVTPLKFQWTKTGPLTASSGGNVGGVTTNKFATYSITSTAPASVTLTITDANNIPIQNGLKTINFSQVAQSNTSWLGTNAIKVGVSADKKKGFFGDTQTVTLSSPDGFNTSENITLTLTVEAESTIESGLPSPVLTNPGPITLNAGAPTANVGFPFPAGTAIGNKWVVKISASNGASRSGFAQILFECNGKRPLAIGGIGTTINSNTGTSITPIQLSATDNDSSSPNFGLTVASTFELVGGHDFGTGVLGAPDGLFINNQNQLIGNALVPGVYKFVVAASATGYARSYSPLVTMTVTQIAIPLSITNPTSATTSIQDNTSFTVSWGISGNATSLFLTQQPSSTPVRPVTGAISQQVQQVGSNVYSVYGQSFYGWTYSVPLLIISSSIQALQKLLPDPTIAVIDEDFALTVNWQPFLVNGDYTIYRGWNISIATPPGNTPLIVFTDGLSNGGSVSARVYEGQLTSGDYTLNMTALSNDFTIALDSNPWDITHQFPAVLASSNVNFDNTTLLLGQTMTITLQNNYTAADAWQIVFPDNTSTGWLPLSTRSVAKALSTPGAQNVIIQTQNDFGASNPPVKLRRQFTQQIFVMDQQFNPQGTAEGAITGTLGIGGNVGFEITNATTGVIDPQPYEVVVRAVARDTITNELKLMIATTRFPDASSLLGTMALDVFPLGGRPHIKELLQPVFVLAANENTSSIPVKIQTTTLPSNSFIGKPMQEFKMTAVGGTDPYSWFSQGLPPGLRMNIDGTISGTPTRLGTFEVTFAVMDSSYPVYIDEVSLSFTIPTDLTITTTVLPGAVVGKAYLDYTDPNNPLPLVVHNLGGLPPYTWSVVAGQLPIGMAIDPNSGVLGGIPCTYNSTTDFNKTYTFTLQVTDAVGAIASRNYSISLSPAVLQYGLLNQPVIVSTEDFKLVVPVFGGHSPYTFTSFADNGVVGSGLQIVNPNQLSAIAGVTPAALTVLTTDQIFYPQQYPANIGMFLSASGGVPANSGLPTNVSYKFLVDTTAGNTLPGAVCYGPLLVFNPVADGVYTVTIKVIDSVGHIASKKLNISIQQLNSGEFTLAPFIMNTNGTPTNPSNWTFTSLPSGFPDPKQSFAYTPGANQYYTMVLLDNGTRKLSNGANPAVTATIINGALPAGITQVSGNSLFGTTGADCVIIFQGTPTTVGGYSFELQLQGIINTQNVAVTAAARRSFNVTVGGGGFTPVVSITLTGELDLDLNTLVTGAVNSTYGWAYPLIAEGGTPPYSFTFLSGTTLPGANQLTLNSLPAFASATQQVNNPISNSYSMVVQAKDSANISSTPATILVKIGKSTTQPIHLLGNNLPTYLYINRPIPANTYFVDADLVANWTATGLPPGITLTNATNNRVYLQGTPTQVGQNTLTITATSAIFGTTASQQFALEVRAQTATIVAPAHIGAKATVGTQYRVVNNNSIISVQYVGFQPGDTNLPTIFNTLGGATVGAPGVSIGGQPTTGNRAVTIDGFSMDYDYLPTLPGTDTLTLKYLLTTYDSLVIADTYPLLVATGTTVPVTVSEYLVTQSLSLPLQISGGNPAYSINVTGTSDPRFVAVNNGSPTASLSITVNQFASGATYNCAVSMAITDNSTPQQTVNATGTLQVTIKQETFIVINFADYEWDISLSSPPEPKTAFIIPNQLMSIPQLGHAPYQFFVDTVTIPVGLGTFIQKSPTNRVLAFALNETNTSASVADVNQSLTPTGTYTVTATNLASAPAPGTYAVTVALRVVDSKGITSSATQHVNVKISA